MNLRYGSLWTYSPRGKSQASIYSQRVLLEGIKQWKHLYIANSNFDPHEAIHERLRRPEYRDLFRPIFPDGTLLVPVPKSTPHMKDALWPSEKICEAVLSSGLASKVVMLLQRSQAMRKSASATPGNRPPLEEHRASLVVKNELNHFEHITLVDDVVTKGTTLGACALMLQECFPHVSITAFVTFRTRGLVEEIDRVLDPFEGTITLSANSVARQDY